MAAKSRGSRTATDDARYARAVPLAWLTANGLGPLRPPLGSTPNQRLRNLAKSHVGLLAATDTAGSTGSRLLRLISLVGGTLTPERLTFETVAADADDITTTIERLCDARLLRRSANGDLTFTEELDELWDSSALAYSIGEPGALPTESLSMICRRIGVAPASNRKADKVAAIAAFYADPDAAAPFLAELPGDARKLLDRIADRGGVSPVPAEAVGLPIYGLYQAAAPRYRTRSPHHERLAGNPELAALAELTAAGLVGIEDYADQVWIWAEAWPALDRPLVTDWPPAPRPTIVQRSEPPARTPPIVILFDRALRHWEANPPPVLKNGEYRLGKPVVRATAKTLGTTPATVDLLAGLAMAMELLLPNEVSRSGRGRKLTIESAWMVAPDVAVTWHELGPLRKWMNLLAYWSREGEAWGHQLLVNRLFVLWELATLEPGSAFESADELAHWVGHRYGSIGVAAAALESLDDLRAFDVVADGDPVTLTELGRLAVTDFEAVEAAQGATSSAAIVQADLTIIAPPDLDPALAARLATVAHLESDAGAQLYRLDETQIVAAIQAGETEDSLVEFLTELSSVPLDDVVTRFVADAARQADKLSIVDAPSVLVANDPAELAAAVAVKAAKLTQLTPTVALSSLPAEKLRTALARKKLTPRIVGDTTSRPDPRQVSDRAEALERHAERFQKLGHGRNNDMIQAQIDRLMADAEDARDPSRRWRSHSIFALGPDTIDAVDGGTR